MYRTLAFLLVVCLFISGPATAGKNPAARTRALNGAAGAAFVVEALPLPEASALKLDGDLSDAIWERAVPISDFRQRDPKEGAEASFRTEARVAYDAYAIYVAVEAFDPEPDKIVGILTRRDSHSPSDWLHVAIDSYYDRRTAYEFAVNPAGVKRDKYYFNDGNEDVGWDAVWDAAVARTDRGWRAEFRIPFSQLRFPDTPRPTFGFALMRQIARLNETVTWPLVAKSRNGVVSQFGDLTGLTLSRAPKKLELTPYIVADLATEPAATDGNPLIDTRQPGTELGLDLKYAVTPGLTLTATVNPDFGQVEADPAVVNLSGFETFFSERRPFFVEGSSAFSFDVDCNDGQCTGLFYSRRIGRHPQRELELGDGEFSSMPAQTTILGATKLTGRIGGFRIGALNAVTSEERAVVALGAVRSKTAVEPLTSYTVLRARKEFTNQSSFGFMFTSTNRRLGGDDDPLNILADAAVTGGVDWDWRVLNRRYSLTGFWAGSALRGTAAAIDRIQTSTVHSLQRPDAGHLEYDATRTALDGSAGQVSFSKISGERIRFNTNVSFKTPGFDINDVGFMRRADTISQSNWLQWRHDRPGRFVRSFRFNVNQWSSHNFDGDRLYVGGNVNAHWVLQSNWGFGAGVNVEPTGFDDRLTRGGPGGYTEGGWSIWSYLDSDSRKPVSVNWFLGGIRYRNGLTQFDFNPMVTYRPTSFLTLSAGIGYTPATQARQWVEQDAAGEYVFGRLERNTVSMTARVNYTITPNLSVQLYAAPFVSSGDYTTFYRLVDGRARNIDDRYAPYAYEGDTDFNYRSFRTTNVLRWEYKPGSALFVVWQQGREDEASYGDFRFGRDFGRVFRTPASNVFLVKMSYWLNF